MPELPVKLKTSREKTDYSYPSNYYIIPKMEQINKLFPSSCTKTHPPSPDASTHHSHKHWPEESVALHSLNMTDGVILSVCI